MKKLIVAALFFASLGYAQINSWQPLQPFKQNAYKRINGGSAAGLPANPDFRVLSNGSIVPTIGTAGTFIRTGATLNPASKTTLSSVAGNAAQAPAFAQGPTAVTHTVGGIYVTRALTNLIIRSSAFDNAAWTKVATATVTADASTDPEGTSTADQIDGLALLDGVDQDSGFSAVGAYVVGGVWLKSSSGTRSVDVTVLDETAVTPESTTETCSVTTAWKLCTVQKKFIGGASGTVHLNIAVNNTTGYIIYGYGASLFDASDTANGLIYSPDFFPTIITAGATVTKNRDYIEWNGAEIQTSGTKKSAVFWVYAPTFSDGVTNNTLSMFLGEGAVFTRHLRAYIDASTGTIKVNYADSVADQDTGDVLPKDRWNQIIIATNGTAGDNATYLNGVSIHTNSSTFAANSLTGLSYGVDFLPSSGPGAMMMSTIYGRLELYTNYRITDSDAATIYAAQKSDYGL